MSRTFRKQPDFLGERTLAKGEMTKVVTVVDCDRSEKTPKRRKGEMRNV